MILIIRKKNKANTVWAINTSSVERALFFILRRKAIRECKIQVYEVIRPESYASKKL